MQHITDLLLHFEDGAQRSFVVWIVFQLAQGTDSLANNGLQFRLHTTPTTTTQNIISKKIL